MLWICLVSYCSMIFMYQAVLRATARHIYFLLMKSAFWQAQIRRRCWVGKLLPLWLLFFMTRQLFMLNTILNWLLRLSDACKLMVFTLVWKVKLVLDSNNTLHNAQPSDTASCSVILIPGFNHQSTQYTHKLPVWSAGRTWLWT